MSKKRNHSMHSKPRKAGGNMLVLIAAVTAGIVILILLFALGYIRLVGTQTERKTAIQAAALAAARDMSKIVITNSDFGFVGLSDSAPNGTTTAAGDNYYTSVHSINTLFGTTLLDYIIADTLNDQELKLLATQDRDKARAAADQLMTTLTNAIAPGGSAQDKDGNTVRPYQSAEVAYQSNQVRMAGAGSSYKTGSLQLTLGAVTGGLGTNTPTPQGWSGSFPASVTVGDNYRSYLPVTYKNQTWVFAGISDTVKLVDEKKFVSSVSGVPWQHDTIVRAEAIHNVTSNGEVRELKTVACAQPASVFDPRPNPGALVVSFPDGIPDGTCAMNRIFDLYGPCLTDSDDDSDMYYSQDGDYPVDTGSKIIYDTSGWPISYDTNRKASNACKIAVYDWYKLAGTRARVDQVVGMHSTTFAQPSPLNVQWPPTGSSHIQIPNGIAQIFRFDPDGYVTHQSKIIKPSPYYVVGDGQTLFESFEVLTYGAAQEKTLEPVNLGPPISDPDGKLLLTKKYDMYIRDYSRKPAVGKHAGQPILDSPFVSYKNDAATGTPDGTASFDTVYDGGKGAKHYHSSSHQNGGGGGGLPLILPHEDFAFFWNGTDMEILRTTNPLTYRQFPVGSGLRLTYHTNGVAVDIRFRRQVQVEDTVIQENPVLDPDTGEPTVDPDTGEPIVTTEQVTNNSNIGYVGLK